MRMNQFVFFSVDCLIRVVFYLFLFFLASIVGVMALDLCADSCQSPARAYLLDVCLPEDHARGLSTFTAMAGLGEIGVPHVLIRIALRRT